MTLRKFLLLLTALLIIALAAVVWFFPSNEDFRTENSFWNGTKNLIPVYHITPLNSLSELPRSPEGATLILIPYLKFTAPELATLRDFITRGGTLVLADDYGYGNQLLAYLELKARFSQHSLLDPLTNYKNRWFPRIPHFSDSALTGNVANLVLNHATSLTNVAKDETLALSSMFSFLDHNSNLNWDEGEVTGRLPVISRHDLGRGQVINIADASIFTNSMAMIEGNQRLIQNIAAMSRAGLFLDQSHLPPSPLHQAKDFLTQVRSLLATPLGILLVVVLTLSLTTLPVWRRQSETLERRLP